MKINANKKKSDFYILVITTCIVIITFTIATVIIIMSTLNVNANKLHKCAQIWARWVLKIIGVEVILKKSKKIEPNRQYIYMPNHQSNVDIPVLLSNIPNQFRWLAKKELFSIPFFGEAMKKCNYISIDRSNKRSAFASLERAAKTIRNDTSILIFPEGTRSNSESVLPLKKGGFVLSIEVGVSIIPIAIKGSANAIQRSFSNMHHSKVYMSMLDPIETKKYTLQNKNKLIAKVHQILVENLK